MIRRRAISRRRNGRLIVLFALSVFLPAVVLAVLAYGGVAKERRALVAERSGSLAAGGTRLRRALADALEKLRRDEENRPWYHYNPLYYEPRQLGTGLNFQPSPLATGGASALIEPFSFFQIAPDGRVTSPVPAGSERGAGQAQELDDRLERSNEVIREVEQKFVPQVRRAQQAATGDAGPSSDRNLKQRVSRKGVVANQQEFGQVKELIEGKVRTLPLGGKGPDSELLVVEASPFRFEGLPGSGVLAYRFVSVPNETGTYGGIPVLRYVQGFKLDLDHIRETLFPALVERDLDVPGATAVLLDAGEALPPGEIAFDETLPELPGHRLVVLDLAPDWVANRVARLSRVLLGASVLLLLVIAGGLTFTLRAVREQVDLARRKSDFVAAVTHELRTPLTGIKMYSDLLRAGWVKDEQARSEYIGFMASETDRLARLVNRVLDFARSEKGRDRPLVPIRLEETIREVERDFGPLMREKGFALSVLIETETAALADRDAVKQILLNLLENSVKYAADARNREVVVRLAEEDDRVVLEVADHGPGVPVKERERIFADFYRPGEELTRVAPGAGLGLALVRRLVEAMEGEVEVRETPGGGATFAVRLTPPPPSTPRR